MFGNPGGLIDMPSAEVAPDGELATTLSYFGGSFKSTLSFQILPRLSGSFRYTGIDGLDSTGFDTYYDRSFDVSLLLLKETTSWPALSIGLRDFLGTGLYGSEYLAATKGFMDGRLRVTAGLGWGRLGSANSIASYGDRPRDVLGSGGIPTYDRWFRGDIGVFGGVSYAATDKLTLKAEYSSDAYRLETVTNDTFDRKSDWNFGLDYQVTDYLSVGGYYMYGSEFGVSVRMALNPKNQGVPGGSETAPPPVVLRPLESVDDLGWTNVPAQQASYKAKLAEELKPYGIYLEAATLTGREAVVQIRNERYDIESQAIGRTARVMSRYLPGSITTFVIAQNVNGMPTGSVALNRADLEQLEMSPADAIKDKAVFASGLAASSAAVLDETYPRLDWSFGPFMRLGFFDVDNPLRADIGLRARASVFLTPGLMVSGSVTSKLAGTLDEMSSPTTSTVNGVPVVRSDTSRYQDGPEPRLETLYAAQYLQMTPDIYGRLSVGYLEQMYAGVSAEVLWKPQDSRLGIGVEANYAKKRDYDGGFGFQDYDVYTGHVSAYYDIGWGFHGQVDVGRYLAGDWGATVAIDREFDNGWSIGAYATKTDISSEDFGEGSFDKGLRFTVPLGWALGTPSRRSSNFAIQSLTRDGGARLSVPGRLYGVVRDSHEPEMAKTWGKFWR
ncbi:YjbH domain-containing protein [Pseudooceanicola nanhaiensis]|uniref:YjbH domain-containing protein n=1 Tax=Pseudooceanicola nanhaiensis TaxID=375761 RepID=UPI001CD293D5|nr:YjbH domain-containing protein [Pseudooceanicola nanhaiensis]MCA0920387.1 YjbH domain-containing protein [Pseudooceanicola nanhaiensis]